MTPPPASPSSPPAYQPVIQYSKVLVVRGVLVEAIVTNLTAAFLAEAGEAPEH